MMEEVDHVANRVGLGTLTGFFCGAAYATVKGFPRRATALRAAASCAIVGTALFSVFGGALNGYMYQKKPLRGMFYFVPVMLGIGMMELSWEKRKIARMQELQDQQNSDTSMAEDV